MSDEPTESAPSAETCFNCGKPHTRMSRLNNNLEIDRDMPLRPVCDDCGPQWNVQSQLGRNTFLVTAVKLYPIQVYRARNGKRGSANESVYLHAYEVYSAVFGPQPAMIDIEGRDCRGGFGVSELVAFLYAHSFPRSEWRLRVDEALRGLNVD